MVGESVNGAPAVVCCYGQLVRTARRGQRHTRHDLRVGPGDHRKRSRPVERDLAHTLGGAKPQASDGKSAFYAQSGIEIGLVDSEYLGRGCIESTLRRRSKELSRRQ